MVSSSWTPFGVDNYREAVDLRSICCVLPNFLVEGLFLKEEQRLNSYIKSSNFVVLQRKKKCKLPLAALFKPQILYESTHQERCKEFPRTAVSLIENLLSVDPDKRGTAASALNHEVVFIRIISSFSLLHLARYCLSIGCRWRFKYFWTSALGIW